MPFVVHLLTEIIFYVSFFDRNREAWAIEGCRYTLDEQKDAHAMWRVNAMC